MERETVKRDRYEVDETLNLLYHMIVDSSWSPLRSKRSSLD